MQENHTIHMWQSNTIFQPDKLDKGRIQVLGLRPWANSGHNRLWLVKHGLLIKEQSARYFTVNIFKVIQTSKYNNYIIN